MTGEDDKERQQLNQCLSKEFKIKTLGQLKYFIGIEIVHFKQSIFISQQNDVTDLLQEAIKTACKVVRIPIDSNLKLGKTEEDAEVDTEM